MIRVTPAHAGIGLGIELFAWLGAAGAFLFEYASKFDAPTIALYSHLKILAMYWLLCASLRIINWACTPWQMMARGIAALLIFLPWLLLASWYLLAFIGLSSWGRITTWPMIKTYTAQSSYLMDALGLPAISLLPCAALAVMVPTLLIVLWFGRFDWTRWIASLLNPRIVGVSALMLSATAATLLVQFASFPLNEAQEPFSLSFFPGEGSTRHQSHIFGEDRILESREMAARHEYRPTNGFKPRNVILIVGDALRADHMSAYGYTRDTTPRLTERLSKQQTFAVSGMRSVCAESTCGLLGLASSRPVHAMTTHPFTLHDVLRLHGYEIHMILGGDHTNFYGLKEAYGKVDSYSDGTNQSRRYINDDFLVLDRANELPPYKGAGGEMFQFHLMSTHGLGLRHTSAERFSPFVNYYRWPKAGIPPSVVDISKGINYYDNGVVQFDKTVDDLLSTLEKKGYLDNAVVVITGDHGESLGEHGMFSHAHEVYENSLGIPMILIRYGYTGTPLSVLPFASQIDIAPTILSELGIVAPDVWQGVALQSNVRHDFIHFQQSNLIGLYDLRQKQRTMKYWKDLKTGKEYVFNISADSLESHNLVHLTESGDLTVWRQHVMPSEFSVPDTKKL